MSKGVDHSAKSKTFSDKSTVGDNSSENDPKSRIAKRRIRFSLLQVLLLTAVVAGWLPVIFARRQIPILESEIETMRLATLELNVTSREQFCARSLPSIWHQISAWKYFAPAGTDLELRLATEGLTGFVEQEFLVEYQAVDLPEGTHLIHLRYHSDKEGHHTKVYIDGEMVLQRKHGPDWLASNGSRSSGDISKQSTTYPMDVPLKLKVQYHEVEHPLMKFGSVRIPSEYDKKGNLLWISPRSLFPKRSPNVFFLAESVFRKMLGHRQGIKVGRSSQQGLEGLLCIEPSLESIFGDDSQWDHPNFGVSIRPVLLNESTAMLSGGESKSMPTAGFGKPISFRDTIAPPEQYDTTSVNERVTEKAIDAKGDKMRLFAHFQPFESGAQPVIEILFDSAHPNRMGFLPHATTDSAPMIACEFTTQFNAQFFWREIELLPNPQEHSVAAAQTALPEALSNLYPQHDFSEVMKVKNGGSEQLPWRNIPLARLPRTFPINSLDGMLQLNLSTDVKDSSKVNFPRALANHWRYEGVPNRQVWYLPESESSDESDPEIKVDIRATSVFPSTSIPIPGGPAIGNVRITVPMPATQPLWLEIVPDMKTED